MSDPSLSQNSVLQDRKTHINAKIQKKNHDMTSHSMRKTLRRLKFTSHQTQQIYKTFVNQDMEYYNKSQAMYCTMAKMRLKTIYNF